MLQSGARPLPLALLSADASPALVREAEAAGAFAFLPKPVQVARLLEVLAGMSEAIRAPVAQPAAPAPDVNAPAIGLEVVQELIALNLGEGFVASFVEQCLRDAGQCMAEMERCGSVADWEGMREAAHALKGLGQNFAARAVAEACDALVAQRRPVAAQRLAPPRGPARRPAAIVLAPSPHRNGPPLSGHDAFACRSRSRYRKALSVFAGPRLLVAWGI